MKNSIIISCSLPKELAEFCDYAKISPSEALQMALFEQKRAWDKYNQPNSNLVKAKEALEEQCQELYEFIEQMGHTKKYKDWHRILKGGKE